MLSESVAKKKSVQIVFTLRAFSVMEVESNTKEEAERFCQGLKKLLLEGAPQHGIEATVEYTVAEE